MRSPRRTTTTAPLRALLLAVLAVLLLGAPASASAGEGYAAPQSWGCSDSAAGSRDRSGTLYVPCGNRVWVLPASGTGAQFVALDLSVPGTKPVFALAPTPDGSAIYTVMYSNANSSSLGMSLQRLVRSADGTRFSLDTTFRPQRFTYAGTQHDVCGRSVVVDAYGYIYVSNGGWCAQGTVADPTVILKYRPDGTLVTQFGDYGAAAGLFNVNMQIAVTPDGRRVYVADHLNVRVQYFDWTIDGSYRLAGSFNHVIVNGTRVNFSALYGVALDPWGYVYVADTTQGRIWKTTPTGAFVTKIVEWGTAQRIHSVSVDARGHVYNAEHQRSWARAADNPVPATRPEPAPEPHPDLTAPELLAITAPAETTAGTVRVQLDARDDLAVTEMRFADESGDWGAWQPFAATADVTLSAGIGTKLIYAQVRDVRLQESGSRRTTVVRRAIPDVTAPTLTVTGPASTTVASVSLLVDAADAIGVTHLRLAGDDGEFGPWLAWSGGRRTIERQLGATYGTYAVAVQVRDAAWNVSATATVRVSFAPAPAPEPPTVIGGGTGVTTQRDTTAPRISTLRLPARSCTRMVTIRIASKDDRGARWMRIANEHGRYGTWLRYRGTVRHALTRGATRKRVTVQVRDAAGNVSRAVSRRVLVVRCR